MRDLGTIRRVNAAATRKAGADYWRNEALTLRRLGRNLISAWGDPSRSRSLTTEIAALAEYLNKHNGD